jgi:hypothetical protein
MQDRERRRDVEGRDRRRLHHDVMYLRAPEKLGALRRFVRIEDHRGARR